MSIEIEEQIRQAIKKAKSWNELHENLLSLNASYKLKGVGRAIICFQKNTSEILEIAPSKLAAWATIKKLENKLGKFSLPPQPEKNMTYVSNADSSMSTSDGNDIIIKHEEFEKIIINRGVLHIVPDTYEVNTFKSGLQYARARFIPTIIAAGKKLEQPWIDKHSFTVFAYTNETIDVLKKAHEYAKQGKKYDVMNYLKINVRKNKNPKSKVFNKFIYYYKLGESSTIPPYGIDSPLISCIKTHPMTGAKFPASQAMVRGFLPPMEKTEDGKWKEAYIHDDGRTGYKIKLISRGIQITVSITAALMEKDHEIFKVVEYLKESKESVAAVVVGDLFFKYNKKDVAPRGFIINVENLYIVEDPDTFVKNIE